MRRNNSRITITRRIEGQGEFQQPSTVADLAGILDQQFEDALYEESKEKEDEYKVRLPDEGPLEMDGVGRRRYTAGRLAELDPVLMWGRFKGTEIPPIVPAPRVEPVQPSPPNMSEDQVCSCWETGRRRACGWIECWRWWRSWYRDVKQQHPPGSGRQQQWGTGRAIGKKLTPPTPLASGPLPASHHTGHDRA